QLAAASDRLAGLGAWPWAAEAANAAADAHRRRGAQRDAATWSRHAEASRGRCETVRSPGLVVAAGPEPLSRREREVAVLAAQGLASRVIGERLFVGTRTVESHLARIYAKLGIRSRAELAHLFGGDGPEPPAPPG
ncbi:MAG TPA: helix-turn-helix transcriptional regulator, partial [Aquihabitans sp.]|nr:helix-turn-helix transcriptional regulator [Aquihabitans sp.]